MGQSPARLRAVTAALIFVLMPAGCIVKYYGGPRSGTSAFTQEFLAEGVAKTFGPLDYSRTVGARICIVITSLGRKASKYSPLEGYLRAFIEEKVSLLGGRIVEKDSPADVYILVRLRASGVGTTERELTIGGYPIHYSLTVSGFTGVDIAGFDARKNEFFLMKGTDKITVKDEIYLLKIFGPIKIDRTGD